MCSSCAQIIEEMNKASVANNTFAYKDKTGTHIIGKEIIGYGGFRGQEPVYRHFCVDNCPAKSGHMGRSRKSAQSNSAAIPKTAPPKQTTKKVLHQSYYGSVGYMGLQAAKADLRANLSKSPSRHRAYITARFKNDPQAYPELIWEVFCRNYNSDYDKRKPAYDLQKLRSF